MKAAPVRLHLIDGVKAIAMQIIVLHHLVSYGPLASAVQTLLPDVVSLLYNHGRMTVQVFLVIGGYLAARKLSPQGRPFTGSVVAAALQRYLRLAPPFLTALLLAITCAACARPWMPADGFIPAAPRLGQWLAHALLLQDLLDYESLSTGLWYVAIDFQLFVLLAMSLRLIGLLRQRQPWQVCASVLLLSAVSMFWINLDARFDSWAAYFFGAYGLGAMAYWASRGERHAVYFQRLLWTLVVLALLANFRWRLVLALVTAVLLYAATRFDLRSLPRTLSWLAQTSYALLLVHFPVFMLVSATFFAAGLADHGGGLSGMAVAWGLSLLAAHLLHHHVELPASRWRVMPLRVRGGLNAGDRPGNY